MTRRILSLGLLMAGQTLRAAVPSEYTLTDITGWSAAQRAALPHFDRFVPAAPAGAGTDFVPVVRNGEGLTAGNRTFSTTWVQGSGAYVHDASQTDIPAWLWGGFGYSYAWSYTYFDGTDYHFQNGFVTHSPVRDMNSLGQIVGYATTPGSGSGPSASLGYADHAWLLDAPGGTKVDLTPDASRADPRGINDLGEITGYWSNSNGYHAFRRDTDGTFTDFTVTNGTVSPTVINNHGHIAGLVTIYSVPRVYYPFISESGAAMTALPLPSQNSPDTASIADINEHDVLVGEAHKSDAPQETSAVRWTRDGNGWRADDLNELLADNLDFILDRAVAISDAGYILATGHPDGGPDNTYNTHQLLLAPDVFAPPSACTLVPGEITATSAMVQAVVDPAALPSGWWFETGTGTPWSAASPTVSVTGTAPRVVTAVLTGLLPHTDYQVRIAATNAEGVTVGAPVTFTTPWTWSAWAEQTLGAVDPESDHNTNGTPDLLDYATAGQPDLLPQWTEPFGRHLVIHHATNLGDAELIVDLSSNLLTWAEGARISPAGHIESNGIAVVISREPNPPHGERLRIAPHGTNPTDFLRLRATLP